MQIYERVTKSRSHTIPLKSKNHQYILCIDDFLRLSQTFDIYQNLDYIVDIIFATREPEKYGSQTLKDLEKILYAYSFDLGVDLEMFQSNFEGEIVERGKHQDLIEQNGYYKRLCDMQSF